MVVQILTLLVVTGIIVGGTTKRTVRLNTSWPYFIVFTPQFIQDIQLVYQNTLTFQGQSDSLAVVVLQNWWGLDLLTAEKGSLCLFLQEKCCFYFNQMGIVKNKMQQLQTDLKKPTEELDASRPWALRTPCGRGYSPSWPTFPCFPAFVNCTLLYQLLLYIS